MRRFQVQRHSALVAIVQVPGVVVLRPGLWRELKGVAMWIARPGWFDFDDVGSVVGQDGSCAGPGDEACEVDDF